MKISIGSFSTTAAPRVLSDKRIDHNLAMDEAGVPFDDRRAVLKELRELRYIAGNPTRKQILRAIDDAQCMGDLPRWQPRKEPLDEASPNQ